MVVEAAVQDLLNTIARCSNIELCIDGKNKNHPCSSIIMSQGVAEMVDFCVPEPWSGRIETAPILFIGDSTIIDPKEKYPTLEWNDYLIKDFFNHRFGGGIDKWVKDGLYPLCSDGTYKRQWNRLWSACANRTLELLETISINPGYDFAVSETSRCRSFAPLSRDKAFEECSSRYLKQIIERSGATVIVGMGNNVRHYICQAYNIKADVLVCGPMHLGDRDRYLVFLPHYNSRGPRSFSETLNRDDLGMLRNYLNKAN